MSKYWCKCGRVVNKSTSAATTGNRDTANCAGCPYLLPYGPHTWDSGKKAFVQDVQGYECRMSERILYHTEMQGNWNDKCTLHLRSLDFDFLVKVCDWVKEHYPPKDLSCAFNPRKLRAAEYGSCGRYCISISCGQNKVGVAAKNELAKAFFNRESKIRLDMTPEEEKAKVLADIEKGKVAAQNKEIHMEDKVYKDAKGILYRVGETGELGNADRCRLTIQQLGITPGAQWRKKSMAPNWSMAARKDAMQALEIMAEENDWKQATEAEVQYNLTERAALLDDDPDETAVNASASAESAAAPLPASSNMPIAFDYSGLSEQTVSVMHLAEREIVEARQTYICRASAAVAMVHEELVTNCDGHNQHSDDTFISWCRSVGLNKMAAYRLLQVDKLLTSSTPEEAAQLEQASPSLLYAAAKPSAPAELVRAVKGGDITTHKQYKELEKQLAEERELRRQAEVGRDAAVKDVRQLEKEQAEDRQWMDSEVEKANQKADLAAQKSAEAWEQIAAEKRARKQAEKELEESQRLADDEIARVQRMADAAADRANTAEAKVKELESRPIEVTGADAADIARWREEGAEQARQETAAQMAAMQEQLEDAYAAQDNAADALYSMAKTVAESCTAQLDNWSEAAASLEEEDYMDCIELFIPLRAALLRLMADNVREDDDQ